MVNIKIAHKYCEEVTRREAKNFAYAFIFLPRRKQRAMNAVYAFARLVDDIADDESREIPQKREDLNLCRQMIENIDNPPANNPLLLALSDTIRKFRIPRRYFLELIEGMEMDLVARRYETFADLKEYCYYVASVVGLISIEIFGYLDQERARKYAIDMGIALQLTNILRDIKEDLERNRIYLPQEDLERFSVTEEGLRQEKTDSNFKEFMAFQVRRARDYYAKADQLFPLLQREAVFCPAALKGIYYGILEKIGEREYDVFSERVRLNTREKLLVAAKCWIRSVILGT